MLVSTLSLTGADTIKLFLTVLLWVISLTALAKPLLFVSSEYTPYVMKSGKGKMIGIMPDLINAAFADSGVSVNYQLVPWKRAESLVQQGKAFAAFPYSKTEQREAQFYFSDVVLEFQPALFYLAENFPGGFTWQSFAQLKPYRIASVIGYAPNRHFERYGIPTIIVSEESGALTMIKGKRADFFLLDSKVGRHLIKKLFPSSVHEFRHTTSPDVTGSYYLMVSKAEQQNKTILLHFNQGLQSLRASGEYQRILRRYE